MTDPDERDERDEQESTPAPAPVVLEVQGIVVTSGGD